MNTKETERGQDNIKDGEKELKKVELKTDSLSLEGFQTAFEKI